MERIYQGIIFIFYLEQSEIQNPDALYMIYFKWFCSNSFHAEGVGTCISVVGYNSSYTSSSKRIIFYVDRIPTIEKIIESQSTTTLV